ncbi:unnamed protein product, partial [Gulo gulo]
GDPTAEAAAEAEFLHSTGDSSGYKLGPNVPDSTALAAKATGTWSSPTAGGDTACLLHSGLWAKHSAILRNRAKRTGTCPVLYHLGLYHQEGQRQQGQSLNRKMPRSSSSRLEPPLTGQSQKPDFQSPGPSARSWSWQMQARD